MKEFIVRKNIKIKAMPSEVWTALTNPEKTKQYFFNCEVFSDWTVGSSIAFKGKIFLFIKIELAGKIVKIEHEKFLQYILYKRNSKDNTSDFSTVTDELNYADGETTLSITDDVGQGEGAEKRYKKSDKAWGKILKGLKEVVEGEKWNNIKNLMV